MIRHQLRTVAPIAASVGFGAAIFAFDVTLPLGAGIGASYVALILIGLWLPSRFAPLLLASAATVLAVIGYPLSPPGGIAWLALLNRGLALAAIWLTAALLVWRRTSEQALRESEERYRRLVEMAPDAILTQQDGRLTFVNPQAVELLGARDAAEILDRPVRAFVHPEDWPTVEARMRRLATEGGGDVEPLEERMVRLDGRVIDVEDRTVAIREGGRVAMQGILRDVTRRKWAEEYIRRLAHHDALTGLPNRLLLQDRLRQASAQARRDGRLVAVMLLDLDHFKDVNDTLGHPAGDRLLCAVADRLRALVRETDTLARLGGDEFIIVQTGLRDAGGAGVLARKVIDALAEPFAVDHHEVHTGTTVGVTLFPADGAEPDVLIRNADLALYRAKAEGRGRFRFFAPAMMAEIQARKGLEGDLRRTLELADGQLGLAYQPLLDLRDGRVVGVEALARWRHPRLGNVAPGVFIPVAEASGLIRPLGARVLREACRQAAAWRDAGRPLGVAVNLSPAQILRQDLVGQVDRALEATGLEPHLLELEITETVFMDPARRAIRVALQRVADQGVGLTIDDFGTGYSSFSYLKSFPVTKLKINGSFVRDIGGGRGGGGEAIVSAIVALGHNLGKRVIAEGVETEAQLAFVAGQGCDRAQGFLLGRPQTPEDLGRFLAAWPAAWRRLQAAVGPIPSAAAGPGGGRLAPGRPATVH
ncbi:MAG TPA: EAL domain-containing protein [Geminicoccaceae bacterium]|nr:EAL domain-containing protein [Geminicoccaceae bacterium]